MKKLLVLLAVLCLLAFAGGAHAVTLDKGWYARFGYVTLSGTEWPSENAWLEDWYATSAVGQFGSMQVEAGPFSRGRSVTFTSATSVQPGVLFEDYGFHAGQAPYYDSVFVGWQTKYNASKLQLRVYRHQPGSSVDELVWAQNASDVAQGSGNIWGTCELLPNQQIVFRLVAVPEPSGMLALAAGVMITLRAVRRRVPVR